MLFLAASIKTSGMFAFYYIHFSYRMKPCYMVCVFIPIEANFSNEWVITEGAQSPIFTQGSYCISFSLKCLTPFTFVFLLSELKSAVVLQELLLANLNHMRNEGNLGRPWPPVILKRMSLPMCSSSLSEILVTTHCHACHFPPDIKSAYIGLFQ